VREVSYTHEDEAEALDKRAKKERASKSEIIRRAVRAYLGIEEVGPSPIVIFLLI
jgi:metal-responsive CopG/Arc/MetJ family transcriptional regulator